MSAQQPPDPQYLADFLQFRDQHHDYSVQQCIELFTALRGSTVPARRTSRPSRPPQNPLYDVPRTQPIPVRRPRAPSYPTFENPDYITISGPNNFDVFDDFLSFPPAYTPAGSFDAPTDHTHLTPPAMSRDPSLNTHFTHLALAPKRRLDTPPPVPPPKKPRETNHAHSSSAPATLPSLAPAPVPQPRPRTTPYVRPKHPRKRCEHCPADSEGFRGEHELRRHKEREHAPQIRRYIIRDLSTTGDFLARCRACASGRTYGADYNATAHLKRQHFNPSKNPGILMPENLRDWVEVKMVDRVQEGGVVGGRRRGRGEADAEAAELPEQTELVDAAWTAQNAWDAALDMGAPQVWECETTGNIPLDAGVIGAEELYSAHADVLAQEVGAWDAVLPGETVNPAELSTEFSWLPLDLTTGGDYWAQE